MCKRTAARRWYNGLRGEKVPIISVEGRKAKVLRWERAWCLQGIESSVGCRGRMAVDVWMSLEAYRPHHEILLGHDEDFDTF